VANDLTQTIATAAATPAAAASDGQSATSRPIADLIAADQYLAGRVAAGNRQRGLSFSKIIKAGTMPDGTSPRPFNYGG